MELAWQFGMPVSELMERIPSYEIPWWRALARLRYEENEEMRLKAKSQARTKFRGEGAGSMMGQR
jgi:hypothetical protein